MCCGPEDEENKAVIALYLNCKAMNMLVIAAALVLDISASAQAAGASERMMRIRQVRFAHVTQLDSDTLENCAERLQAQIYESEKWPDEVAERARTLCWQTRGYFRAAISATANEYARDEYSVLLSVKEGSEYRLGHIAFQNLRVVLSTSYLRPEVPLHDGDIYDSDKIKDGIEKLRKLYAELGYINFTSKVDTEVDDEQHVINLRWNLNEGQPFFVRIITFEGVSPAIEDSLRSRLLLTSSNVYNHRLLEESLARMRTLLPPRTALTVKFSSDAELNVLDLRIQCASDANQK